MVIRTISTACCKVTARASSRGAVPNTSLATARRPRSGCLTQSTKAAMPAWATRPIHDRFSADIARNHGSRCSMDAMAAVPSDPIARCSRWMVSSRTRPAGPPRTCPPPSWSLAAPAPRSAWPAAVIPPECHGARAVGARQASWGPGRPVLACAWQASAVGGAASRSRLAGGFRSRLAGGFRSRPAGGFRLAGQRTGGFRSRPAGGFRLAGQRRSRRPVPISAVISSSPPRAAM